MRSSQFAASRPNTALPMLARTTTTSLPSRCGSDKWCRIFCLTSFHFVHAPHLRQQDDELVATVAACRVACADAAQQTGRHMLKNRISRGVPENIVHSLEVIQIDEQHTHGLALSRCLRQRLLEPVEHQGTVRKPGERIVTGESTCLHQLTPQALDLLRGGEAASGASRARRFFESG